MAIDAVQLAADLKELRGLANAKLEDEPLPNGEEAGKRLRADIERYDLKSEIADLDTKGYAILPPGKAKPLEFFDRLREAILRLAQTRRHGELGPAMGFGTTLYHLLPYDRVFEEALMAPATLTLVTYLVGYRAKLSQSTAIIKDSRAAALGMHADHSGKLPEPWPNIAQYCNVTWVTTDYTRENGAVCVWPGSHRFCRPVPDDVVFDHGREEIEVLEMPKGSVIVWHGSLWHGAVPRTTEGQRVTLVLPHVRDHVQPQEIYWATTTPEMIARNPARFSTLMGLHSPNPWLHDGPSLTARGLRPVTGSQFE